METLAVRNQNPGNLKDPKTGNFRSFSDPIEGKAALYNDLTAKMTGTSTTGLNGDSNLIEFAKTYAPASDKNDPIQYAANLANKLGVSPDTKIGTLTSRIDDFAHAVAQNEDVSTPGFNPKPYSNPGGGSTPTTPGQFDLTGTQVQTTTKPKGEGLGSDLAGRINDISSAVTNTTSRKINPVSGVIQTAGALGGALGDVVNAGLELIPGFKRLEGLLGKGIGKVAQTEGGQAVGKAIQEFSEEHPELSKDIGAGFNIVTAIPILKGLGTMGNIGADIASKQLMKVAEKSVAKELAEVAGRTVGGRKLLGEVPDAIEGMVKTRALPEIEGGVWKTAKAHSDIGKAISVIEGTELQPALAQAAKMGKAGKVPIKQIEKAALETARQELKDPGSIKSFFKRLELKYGKNPTLEQINEAKRTVAKNISEAGFNSPTYTADKIVRSSLQEAVETGAKKLGLGDVAEMNQRMRKLIRSQKLLKYIDGKAVKNTGVVHEVTRGLATAGGEMAGNAVGIPIAGAVAGNKAGGLIERVLSGVSPKAMRTGILKRTTQGAVRQTVKGTVKKLGGLVGASSINRLNQ